jgi:hypothetical protein
VCVCGEGGCALLWEIWNMRNDFTFNKPNTSSFLEVIPLATYWVGMWSFLQPVERREDMVSRCNHLNMVLRDLCNQFGWRHVKRIDC